MGSACSSDDDCAAGLACGPDAVCEEQAAPDAAEDAEAAPGASDGTEAAPVDASPWGEGAPAGADTPADPAPVDPTDGPSTPDSNPESSP